MAQQLCAPQQEESACRAALIQAQSALKQRTQELEASKFERNYWKDRAETQEQTIRLLQSKCAYKDGQISELRSTLSRATDDDGILINIHSGFDKPQ